MESIAVNAPKKRKYKKSNLAKRNVEKFLRNKLAILGFCMIVVMMLLCAFAPLLSPYGANDMSLSEIAQAPSLKHLFGTDKLGRDVFARVLYGGRISIFIGLAGALGGMILGVIFGSLATGLAALATYWLRRKGYSKWLAPLPALVINALVVGYLLAYVYEVGVPMALCALSVAAGQATACYGLGMPLMGFLDKQTGWFD